MLASIIVSCVTLLTLTLSVIFFPEIKVAGRKIGLYWIIAVIGAFFILITHCADLRTIFDGLTADSAVNPLKILVLFFSMTFLRLSLLGFCYCFSLCN